MEKIEPLGFLFFILGPNSARKSQTARDVASWIETKTKELGKPQTACMFSRGSVFRAASADLSEMGLNPYNINEADIKKVLEGFEFRRKPREFEIGLFDNHGNGKEHSLHNGNKATEFAGNPLFQELVLSASEQIIDELRHTFDFVIVEGRDSSPFANDSVWLTGNHKTVRTRIKRHEYPEETAGKSDEDIEKGIIRRDCIDFRKKSKPMRIPSGIDTIIRRSFDPDNPNEEEHQSIVKRIGKKFLAIT